MKKIKINKKVVIMIISIIILVIFASIILFFTLNKSEDESLKLSSSLKNLGIDFYENFYYKQIGKTDNERKEFLEKYKDIGIKVSLDNLSRYKKDDMDDILKQFINDKTKEECNRNSSMVIIYPKDPYGQKDYTIDAILVCGFEEKEEK